MTNDTTINTPLSAVRKNMTGWKLKALTLFMALDSLGVSQALAKGHPNTETPSGSKTESAMMMSAKKDAVFGQVVLVNTGKVWTRGVDKNMDMVRDTTGDATRYAANVQKVSGKMTDEQIFKNLMAGDSELAQDVRENAFQHMKEDVTPDTVASFSIGTPMQGVSLDDIRQDIKEGHKHIISSKYGTRFWKNPPKGILKFLTKLVTKRSDGADQEEFHEGTDIRHPIGTPVYATFVGGGTVEDVKTTGLTGITIRSDASPDFEEISAHVTISPKILKELAEGKEVHVDEGETIGYIHATDDASNGTHEHKAYKYVGKGKMPGADKKGYLDATKVLQNGGFAALKQSETSKELGSSETKKILATNSYEDFMANASKHESKKAMRYMASNVKLHGLNKQFMASSLNFIINNLEGGYNAKSNTNYGIQGKSNGIKNTKNLTKTDAIHIYNKDYIPYVTNKHMSPGMYLIALNVGIHKGVGNATQKMIQNAKGNPRALLNAYSDDIVTRAKHKADARIAKLEIKKARELEKANGEEKRIARIEEKYTKKEHEAYATVYNFEDRVAKLDRRLTIIEMGLSPEKTVHYADLVKPKSKSIHDLQAKNKLTEIAQNVFHEKLPQQQASVLKMMKSLKEDETNTQVNASENIMDSKPVSATNGLFTSNEPSVTRQAKQKPDMPVDQVFHATASMMTDPRRTTTTYGSNLRYSYSVV
jgi:murein DD-endopeptidase MepM/ murein hydrolase activator NlpD